MSHLIFWQNSISIHQAPVISALCDDLGQSVQVVAAENIPADRRALGWTPPSYGTALVQVSTLASVWDKIASDAPADSVHIVSGLGAYPLVSRVTRALVMKRRQVYGITEPWNPRNDLLGRKLVRRTRFASVFPWALKGIFTTGPLGSQQITRMGIPPVRIFDWGYFPDFTHTADVNEEYDIAFVGSLTPRKDVMTLLSATSSASDLRLAIVGDGPDRALLEGFTTTSTVENARFFGSLGARERDAILSRSKILVLPSLFDGWGAVVNEALLAGCSVVAANTCGAASLGGNGLPVYTFRAGDVAGLSKMLRRVLGSLTPRQDVQRLATEQISPLRAAEYFLRCLEASPTDAVQAPWVKMH